MKFKYLKLSLLMVAISAAPFAMNAQADVEGAAQLLLELTDAAGPKRSMEQTINVIDQIVAKLQGEPEYQDTCNALIELKETLIRLNIAQAQGILSRVTNQLETMYSTLSEGMKNQLVLRKEQLANMNWMGKGKLLGNLGLSIDLATLRKLFAK